MRRYRQTELTKPDHYSLAEPKHYSFMSWTMHEFGEVSYTKSIVIYLIEKIKSAPESEDPLKTIHDFINWIDEIRMNQKNQMKDDFVGTVMRIAEDLEQYLWEDEIQRLNKEETDASY